MEAEAEVYRRVFLISAEYIYVYFFVCWENKIV